MKPIMTPEDRFNQIIDQIEIRAMATDGPVTPTLKEATEEELSELWQLVNEISPQRKALARRIAKGKETDEDVNEYLRQQGEDPEILGKQGLMFVKVLKEKIALEKMLREVAVRNNLIFPETEEEMKWADDGCDHKKTDLFVRLCKILKLVDS